MKKSLLLGFLSLMLISCTNYKNISIVDIRPDNVSFLNTSQVLLTLGVKVDNPTGKKLTLDQGILEVFRDGQNLATLTVNDSITIAPKSNEYNKLEVLVEVKDLIALVNLDMNDRNTLEQFDVEGYLKVKSGLFSKRLKIDRMNLNDLLKSLK